jgi:NAD(P)H-dependent FMN reductase
MTSKSILLICGSVRDGSSNQALLDTAAAVAPAGIATPRFFGLGTLPQFNPDDDHDPLPPTVAQLRRAIDEADAVLVCTPEYAGALPGSMKNLLDWTVGGIETTDKPCGWINISTMPGGAAGAHAELGTVLRYTGARIIEEACIHIPVGRAEIGPDGLVTNQAIRQAIGGVLTTLAHQ